MPDHHGERGHSARLLRALTWAGVGLAPVAAIVVLLGGSSKAVRFAVLLLAACIVLIGAAMLIRSDPVLLRMDVEDRVAAEVDLLREELRAEIAAGARVTQHRVQGLEDRLSSTRSPTAYGTARPSAVPPPARHGSRGRSTPSPGSAEPGAGRGERTGKRRADVTAVDLGYTGRRHSADDYAGPHDDRNDPLADEYDWRRPGNRW